VPPDLVGAIRAARGPLPYPVARRLLEAYGIRFCRETIAATADDAARAADTIGYPVVVKAEAPGLVHKSEAGAVRLDLVDAGAVRAACAELAARLGARAFVVQERVGPGVEVLVGARRDPSFGPLVAVGTGGILAEVVRDVSFSLAPLDRDEARAMWLEGIRPRLLAGPRGLPAADLEPLVDAALAVGELLLDEPRVLELDLNPVIAAGSSAVAVDALVILE
jgi:acyl-CoA synthetase (NDP forming)